MNGLQCTLGIYLVMLEDGEDEATGARVAETVNRLYPCAKFLAYEDECQFWLDQQRQHLRFVRDKTVPGAITTISDLLQTRMYDHAAPWGMASSEAFYAFRETLIGRGLIARSTRERGKRTNERKSIATRSRPPFSAAAAVSPA